MLSVIAVWVIFPFFNIIGKPYTFSHFNQSILQHYDFVKIYKQLSYFMSGTSMGENILLIFFTLAVWSIFYFILNLIGKIIFLNRWENKQVNQTYHAVLNKCKELAGYYDGFPTTQQNI